MNFLLWLFVRPGTHYIEFKGIVASASQSAIEVDIQYCKSVDPIFLIFCSISEFERWKSIKIVIHVKSFFIPQNGPKRDKNPFLSIFLDFWAIFCLNLAKSVTNEVWEKMWFWSSLSFFGVQTKTNSHHQCSYKTKTKSHHNILTDLTDSSQCIPQWVRVISFLLHDQLFGSVLYLTSNFDFLKCIPLQKRPEQFLSCCMAKWPITSLHRTKVGTSGNASRVL